MTRRHPAPAAPARLRARTVALLVLPLLAAAACSSDTVQLEPPETGCPGAEYPEWSTSAYVLPYPVGVRHRVDLSNCSGSFHGPGLPDQFAVDFNMPIGTPITAARGGVVIFVEESGFDGSDPDNVVLVDHGDGSYASYNHLTRNGAAVAVGDTVRPGDSIGASGVTGLAGYPHLHFVVIRDPTEFPYQSLPVTFRNTDPNPRGLVAYTPYAAGPH